MQPNFVDLFSDSSTWAFAFFRVLDCGEIYEEKIIYFSKGQPWQFLRVLITVLKLFTTTTTTGEHKNVLSSYLSHNSFTDVCLRMPSFFHYCKHSRLIKVGASLGPFSINVRLIRYLPTWHETLWSMAMVQWSSGCFRHRKDTSSNLNTHE